jgi:hypothetical protein
MEQAMRAQIEEARRREAAQALGQMGGPAVRPPPPPMMQPQERPGRRGPVVPPMRSLPLPQGAPRPVRVPPPPTVPPPAVRRPGPITQSGPGQRQRQQPKKQQQRRRAPQLPVPAWQLEELPPSSRLAGQVVETPGVRESEIGAGATPASPARRQAVAGPRLRLTPQMLREQFILTEILQPPLALRDHPPGG